MDLDERLESAGLDSDSRIAVDNARIVVGEVGDRVCVSLLGQIYGDEFGATAVGNSVGGACATLADLLSKNLKVLDATF